jgi:hypothetical protein
MTVFTPEAVQRMVAEGIFRKVKLKDVQGLGDVDEIHFFRLPSTSAINERNGDGDWLEVVDYSTDFSEIDTDGGGTIKLPDGGETFVYVNGTDRIKVIQHHTDQATREMVADPEFDSLRYMGGLEPEELD